MAISSGNLKYYLSGGASNSDPNASLGGARSTTTISPSDLFDYVSSEEAAAGDTEYRCIYFLNADADSNGLLAPIKLWVLANTPSADTTIEVGLDPAGKNATATTVADENTAPSGVTFSAPTSKTTGITVPSAPFAQNDYIAIWIKRVINAGALDTASDTATIRIEGDTI